MQTKLKTAFLLLAVSLLWTQPKAFAATQPKAQKGSKRVIGTASKHHSTTHNVTLVWCDLHVCQEKPRFMGIASYYGKGYWQGRKMANGQPFDYRQSTVALWFLPLGTMVRVTNLDNGLTAVAEVTDRGPAHSLRRIADFSQAVAEELDYIGNGLAHVTIQAIVACAPEYLYPNDGLALLYYDEEPPQIEVEQIEVTPLDLVFPTPPPPVLMAEFD
jgi:rare lipoprotein A